MSDDSRQRARDSYGALMEQMAADPSAGIARRREVFDSWAAAQFPVPADLEVQRLQLGGVGCDVVRAPGASAQRTIVHFHGGGFVLGSAVGERALGAALSVAASATVVLPDYRLAPEHRSPAPVEDGVAVYRALVASGTDPARIVVCGDSAGGGIALAVLVMLRDAGDALPGGAVAMSPWADATLTSESVSANARTDRVAHPKVFAAFVPMRLGPDGDPRDPIASPVFADWTGMPPLLLFASTTETLRDDAVAVADAARAAGVEARLEIYEDMVHVWPFFADFLPEGRQAIDAIGAFVRERTG